MAGDGVFRLILTQQERKPHCGQLLRLVLPLPSTSERQASQPTNP